MKRLIRDMLISSAACSLESAGTGTVGRRKTGSPIGGDKRNLSHVTLKAFSSSIKLRLISVANALHMFSALSLMPGCFFSPTIYLNHHRFEGDFFFTEEIQS